MPDSQTGLRFHEVNRMHTVQCTVDVRKLLGVILFVSLKNFQFAPYRKSIEAACGLLVLCFISVSFSVYSWENCRGNRKINCRGKYVLVLLGFFYKKQGRLISF